MECRINQINVGRVRGAIPFFGHTPRCQDIPVPALHANGSLAEARGCSGTLRTPGSLMEDLLEVKIPQGLFRAGLVQSPLLNTTCIERYSPVLQVTLLREHFPLLIRKNTLPLGYVSPIHCNPP